jgi:hypothetical protein
MRGAPSAPVGERAKSFGEAKNARGQRNFPIVQAIRVAASIPTLVMPAHEQLRSARQPQSRRFAFADNRMTRKVKSFVVSEFAVSCDVVAAHREQTRIMDERGEAQRKEVFIAERDELRDFFRERGNARGVRLRVAQEVVSLNANLLRQWCHVIRRRRVSEKFHLVS